jgi:hypothetical protein
MTNFDLLLIILSSSLIVSSQSPFPDCWKPVDGAPGYLSPYTSHSRWAGSLDAVLFLYYYCCFI